MSRAIRTQGLRQRQVCNRGSWINKDVDGVVDVHTSLIGRSKDELSGYLVGTSVCRYGEGRDVASSGGRRHEVWIGTEPSNGTVLRSRAEVKSPNGLQFADGGVVDGTDKRDRSNHNYGRNRRARTSVGTH